jgi:hypothetical protein
LRVILKQLRRRKKKLNICKDMTENLEKKQKRGGLQGVQSIRKES